MPDIKSAEDDFERELQAAIDLIVESNHRFSQLDRPLSKELYVR